jgi:hypothetical protein
METLALVAALVSAACALLLLPLAAVSTWCGLIVMVLALWSFCRKR